MADERKPIEPIGYVNDASLLLLETGHRGEIHPTQHDGLPPYPVWTADQIRRALDHLEAEMSFHSYAGKTARAIIEAELGIEEKL